MVVCEYSRTIYRKVPVIFCKKKTVPRPLLIIYDLHLSPQAQQRKFLLILSLLFFPPKTAIPSGGYPADNFPEVISKSRCSDCKNLSSDDSNSNYRNIIIYYNNLVKLKNSRISCRIWFVYQWKVLEFVLVFTTVII